MNIHFKLFFLLFTLLSHMTYSYAEETFPPGCKVLPIKTESIQLPEGKVRVLMVHNLSSFDIWITGSDNSSSKLEPNHWSALALNESAFELNCVQSQPGHEQQIACEQALGVCEWPITTRPENATGIFWAGENMTLTALSAYIARNGFELPQKSLS